MTEEKKTPRGVTPELEDGALDGVTGGFDGPAELLYRCPNCGYECRCQPSGMYEGSTAPWCPNCIVINHCSTRMIKVG